MGGFMDQPLRDRRILVTGAASGIGAAAVQVFSDAGAMVAATYRKTPPPAKLADAATWLRCDLQLPEQADRAVAAATAHMEGLDAVLHAAGTWLPGPAGEITEDNLDSVLANIVKATIFVNQAAFRAMLGRGGRIINLGSAEAVMGSPISASYASAKGAVHSWTRSAAKAWGQYGITVNAVDPSVETPGTQRFRDYVGEEVAEARQKQVSELRPVASSLGTDMHGDPVQDLGPVLVFLASSGSPFVSGQILAVSGGLLLLGA